MEISFYFPFLNEYSNISSSLWKEKIIEIFQKWFSTREQSLIFPIFNDSNDLID